MFKFLARLFKFREHLNEEFIYVMRIAQEDESVRKTLIPILEMDPYLRKQSLRQFAYQVEKTKAPREFVEAIIYLADDEIAETMLVELNKIN
ncbi:hypothetical protein C2869_00120 [Saccharobesus litoralis]|uniref:Uncharacterized protein n=1 Tax=Saccharobesus litoralis TaxID=2172099 RepID=A0A2S0VL63_9ALTE|nr:hypothetical protein [Saccharobesus litoralis]AWB64941.1 hypothetical protein C2869_00120 [Saccharobesus litoralis]